MLGLGLVALACRFTLAANSVAISMGKPFIWQVMLAVVALHIGVNCCQLILASLAMKRSRTEKHSLYRFVWIFGIYVFFVLVQSASAAAFAQAVRPFLQAMLG